MRGILISFTAMIGSILHWRRKSDDGKHARHNMVPGRGILLATILIPLAWFGATRRVTSSEHSGERVQALFDAIIDNCTDIIWLKNIDGVYMACNHAAAALLDLSPNDVIGKTDADLFPPEIAQSYRQTDQKVIETGGRVVEEQIYPVGEDGALVFLDMVKSAVVQADGKLVGVLGVARDVTERRHQETKIREQEVLLQEMSSLASIGGWELDLVANTFSWTEELARLHEFDPSQVLTLDMLLDHYVGADRLRLEQAMTHTLEEGAAADLDVQMVLPSGVKKWMRAHWRTVMEDGKVTRVWAMAQDMTERRKLDESIRMADLIYRTTSDAILVTDEEGRIVDANPAFLRLTGYLRDEVIGVLPRQFRDEPDNFPSYRRIVRTLEERGHWEGEMRLSRKSGEGLHTFVEIDVMRNGGNGSCRRIVHVRDLTEQKRKDAQIWKHANFDPLTGLPNRSLLLDRLDQVIKKARQDDSYVGVLCIDLDRFTEINDSVGHARGDAVLVEVTARLRTCVPDNLMVGRLGADRFIAVLTGARAHLELNAAAIVRSMGMPFDFDAESIHISASVGITLYPDDAVDAYGLTSRAEQAMTTAKRAGGNRFQYFAPALHEAALTKVRLISDLRMALGRHELRLYYQPIVDVRSGRIRKAEALIRWIHPALGLVEPARFIPLAEESGLIVQIGNWVIEEAIASVEHWRRDFDVDMELSVNQSPVQFEQSVGSGWIERLMGAGLPKHSITVEITESMLVNDSSQMRTSLKLLQASGAKVSLDDFGTGFSALSYLKLFEIDYLKIDKSFILNIENDTNDKALTQAIIDLAHKLKIETIAEGVETAAQRDILTDFGCDYLQGYFYSKPVAREAFEHLLEKRAV